MALLWVQTKNKIVVKYELIVWWVNTLKLEKAGKIIIMYLGRDRAITPNFFICSKGQAKLFSIKVNWSYFLQGTSEVISANDE